VLQHALAPETPGSITQPATYGAFMEGARAALHQAVTSPPDPADAGVAMAVLKGYTRFLRVAGIHLETLQRLGRTRPQGLVVLTRRLVELPRQSPGDTAWDCAADQLGIAHDIVSTHLGPHGELRTREVADVFERNGSARALSDVTELVLVAIESGTSLVHTTGNPVQPMDAADRSMNALVALNSTVRIYAKATLWEVAERSGSGAADDMASLQPAPITRPGRPTEIASALQALRLLRQASYGQARDETSASPRSLRDLSRLGARVTDSADTGWLPEPRTGLERVERAHLLDALDQANTAWTQAASGLTEHLQGTTQASAAYGAAIQHLLGADRLSPQTRTAILTALPRLGTDATSAIERLSRENALFKAGRDPGKLSISWHPLGIVETDQLRARFTQAADRTRPVATQVRRAFESAQPPTARSHPDAEHARQARVAESPARSRAR
jgi:hypothetical protein